MRFLTKAILMALMCLYLLVLSKLILFKFLTLPDILSHFTLSFDNYYWSNHNFIPFKTIIFYLFIADLNFNIKIENLAGNIIAFVPFGMILPLLLKRFRSFKKVVLASLCLSLTFELTQLLFNFGSFDVDDLTLNTFGGILGYTPFHTLTSYKYHKKEKRIGY